MTENTTWPGWRQVRKLGSGSFGTVYEICREDNPRFRDALKVITIPRDESEINDAYYEGMDKKSVTSYFKTKVDDVIREIELMYQLEGHTNIVSYKEHRVIPHGDGIGWDVLIKMQLLTPLQVYERERGYGLTEEETIKLGIDICEALIRCNKEGIIHRDIKPQNIFVNNQGDFVLGDFGIARVLDKSGGTMSIKGSPDYMAPEIWNGQKQYDRTVDYYSLGMVLYHCMNRNRGPFLPAAPLPITYQERDEAKQRRLRGEVLPVPAGGSDKLKKIILQATHFKPEIRFQSAEEFQKALLEAKGEIQVKPNEKGGVLKEELYVNYTIKMFEKSDESLRVEDPDIENNVTVRSDSYRKISWNNSTVKNIKDREENISSGHRTLSSTLKLVIVCGVIVVILLLVYLILRPIHVSDSASDSSNTSVSSSVPAEGDEKEKTQSDSEVGDTAENDFNNRSYVEPSTENVVDLLN